MRDDSKNYINYKSIKVLVSTFKTISDKNKYLYHIAFEIKTNI